MRRTGFRFSGYSSDSMHKKIIAALLGRIRSRSDADATALSDSSLLSPPVDPDALSVREAQFSDFNEVYEMNRRLGQGKDSIENWYRLWRDNPALKTGQATSRIGWALLDGSRIVGFLGNIPLLYKFRGKTLVVTATCRLAVEPGYRGFSHLLVNSFFRQKDVDLFLNTTATVGAGKMMTALRAPQVPQPDYGKVLFWVLRPGHFVQSVLQRAGASPTFARIFGAPGGLVVRGEIFFRGRKPRSRSSKYVVRTGGLETIGPEFTRFWEEQARQARYLFASRSPEVMRWHFDLPDSQKSTSVLSCWDGSRLVGYAIVRHEPPQNGVSRSLLADLMIEEDERELILSLLSAAHASAKKAGSDVFEVLGFPKAIREVCLDARPYSRDYPACPYFYKAREPELRETLKAEDAWYACPYDGDTTLWP